MEEQTTDTTGSSIGSSKPLADTTGSSAKLYYTIVQILLVFGLLMFAVNQGYFYWKNTESIRDPCGVCLRANPPLQKCIDSMNTLVENVTYYRTMSNFSFQPLS